MAVGLHLSTPSVFFLLLPVPQERVSRQTVSMCLVIIPAYSFFILRSQNATARSIQPSATVPVPSPKPWGVMESDGFEKKKIKKEPADSPKRYLQTSSKCTNPK